VPVAIGQRLSFGCARCFDLILPFEGNVKGDPAHTAVFLSSRRAPSTKVQLARHCFGRMLDVLSSRAPPRRVRSWPPPPHSMVAGTASFSVSKAPPLIGLHRRARRSLGSKC
jgi:hypothetical protein